MATMQTTALISLLTLCLCAPTAGIAAPPGIRQLEQDFNAAYAANDLDRYFSFYTDDAVFWFSDEGRTDVPRYRKEWADFLATGAGIRAAKILDLQIHYSPRRDAAVASYVLHLTTQEADKKIHTEDHQETDVWFKTDGGWKIAHVQYSDAPKKSAKP